MAPDGGNQKQLTVNAGANKYPSVSPDGRYIVFVSDRTGGSHIWRMDIDGGNLKQLTSGKSNASGRPLCSSDGKWVVYTSSAADEWTSTLWKVPIDGGDPVQLTDKHSASPAISPDGKRIACYYRDGLNSEGIALIPLEGGSPARIFHIRRPRVYPLDLRWRPDGSALTYIDTRGSSSNIWSQPLASGSPIPLTDFKAGEIYFFDWSRDGKQLAFSRRTTTSDVVLISGFK
jgi:Tol biopolymer transport system component